MQLLLFNNVVIIQICLLIYITIVILVLLYKLYLLSFNVIRDYSLYGIVWLNSRQFSRLYSLYVYLCLLLLKIFKLHNCSIFFGHILITNISYYIFIALLLTTLLIIRLLISLHKYSDTQLLQLILLSIITSFIFNILWSAVNYFTILFALDCLNILILILILMDIDGNTKYVGGLHLLGAGIYFWISFISTVLLLFGGLYLLDVYMTSSMNLMLLYSELLFGCGIVNNVNTALYTLFFITGLFLKAGLGPFFIWKRRLFSNLRLTTLMVYNLTYYFYLFTYVTYILLKLIVYVGFVTKLLLFILIIFTVLLIINSLERGPTFGDLLVISTLLNTVFILCCIVAVGSVI